jgi:hypothetical protein
VKKKVLSLVFVFALALVAGYAAAPSAGALRCSDQAYKIHHDENGHSSCFGDGSECIICYDEIFVDS